MYNFNKGRDPDTQLVNGITALKKEVGKLTGIAPDFYVVVQWEAVGRLVEAIGGVHFEVPFDMDYDDPTPGQDLHIHLKQGYQELNGEQAMGPVSYTHLFVVMDEIEAALDDNNVVRFARYMRGMSEKTQFIVITHRRGTMEEADVLYGCLLYTSAHR